MDKTQEPQRGRTRLDEIASLVEMDALTKDVDGHVLYDVRVALAFHAPLLVELAQACRDAAYAVEQAHREYEAQWMVKYAESIKAIIEALAPLLEHSPTPGEGDTDEGDEAEAGGV